jgi:hypothetical protein
MTGKVRETRRCPPEGGSFSSDPRSEPRGLTIFKWRGYSGRAQGPGLRSLSPLGLTLLTSAFRPGRRGSVVGIWGGIAGLAVAAGR